MSEFKLQKLSMSPLAPAVSELPTRQVPGAMPRPSPKARTVNESPDLTTFEHRAREFFNRTVKVAITWFDAKGNWLPPSTPASTRDRYWLCFALYAQGATDLADAVIRAVRTHGVAHDGMADSSFDIFATNIACVLLIKHRSRMAPDVVEKLEQVVREGLCFLPGNRQPDYQFHGYNDNMPAKATMGNILGGEMLGDAAAVEHGLWNLRSLRNMLFRRGINSEYNSPSYTPLTIHAMAEIAQHAKNQEARDLALKIEHRLWLDLAARFHPEIGIVSGPCSRAYNCDTIAHLSSVSVLIWFVLGDTSRPSLLEIFNPDHGFVLHQKGDLPHNIMNRCWTASGNYHVPSAALRMFESKSYPFRAVATAEAGDGGLDVPAGPVRIETYLQKDYTVGTSSTHFLSGEQSMTYFATFKRKPEINSFRDIGTIFHKFTVNDEAPGLVRSATDSAGNAYSNSGEQDNLDSKSHMLTLQSDSTVMLHTQPALGLAGIDVSQLTIALPGQAEAAKPRPIRRLNEMLVFPAHFSGADEVRIGNRAASSWVGNAASGEWIGARIGKLLVAIRPMAYTESLGKPVVTLEKINNYEVIRTTFYKGPDRIFTRGELKLVFGGYVIEHAGTDEYPSLSSFMGEISKSLFTDFHLTTRRMRYRRPEIPGRPALEMELSTSTSSRLQRYAVINGMCISQDVRVRIDGLEDNDIPIINEPWKSTSSYFPWEDIYVPWWGLKGTIGDREV